MFTTDPEKGALRAIARADGITAFDVPPDVGGRYSVLTAVGLVPAALLEMDVAQLLAGAEAAVQDAAAEEFAANDAARYRGVAVAGAGVARGKRARGDAVLRPAEGVRRMVPAALGREPREEAGSRGPRGISRTDSGRCRWRHRPALAGSAVHRGAIRQDDHLHPGPRHRQPLADSGACRSRPRPVLPAGQDAGCACSTPSCTPRARRSAARGG